MAVLLEINYSFRTYRYHMSKSLKTLSVPIPDRRGGGGGGLGQGAKALRAGFYAQVSTHDPKTLPMKLFAMRDYAKSGVGPSPSRFKA